MNCLLMQNYLRIMVPILKTPHADTLKGSDYDNMKELRFKVVNGVWRIAFAFDTKRKAILQTTDCKS